MPAKSRRSNTPNNPRLFFALVLCGLVVAAIFVVFHKRSAANRHLSNADQTAKLTPFQRDVVADLDRQTHAHIWYVDGYYVGGDPPPNIGVCTDVVIRSYRAAGIDLKRGVNVDIRRAPSTYGIKRADINIDHRRCRTLAVFFKRRAKELPIAGPHADWEAGDIVMWSTNNTGNPTHIGVVSNHLDASGQPTVVHGFPGQFVMEQDWLHRFEIVSHFRWTRGRDT